MRLTKIHARKYSRFLCFAAGSLLTLGLSLLLAPDVKEIETQVVEAQSESLELRDFLDGYTVSSWASSST